MPSRLFIYYNERAIEGSIAQDSGAQIRDGMKSINRQGVCDEKLWPYHIADFTKQPPRACYVAASKERALKYQRVAQNLEALKTALVKEQQPVVFGFSVYESFESEAVKKTGRMPMPKEGEKLLGGHAVLCVGYDDAEQMFIVRNSWSSDWGMAGYFLMPYAFMLDSSSASDFWIIETIDSDRPEMPPVAPGDEAYSTTFPAFKPTRVEPAQTCEPSKEKSEHPTLALTGRWGAEATTRTAWEAGKTAQITWDTHGDVAQVKIMYGVNSWSGMFSSYVTIAESVNNHGSFDWCIPADAVADTRYYVRIESADEPSVACTSGYVEVTAAET